MAPRHRAHRAAILALVAACGDVTSAAGVESEDASASASSGNSTSAAASTFTSGSSDTGTAASTTANDALDDSTTVVPKFDLGVVPDAGRGCDAVPRTCGCTAVDVLFVVHQGTSPQDYAPSTTEAFNAFVDVLVETVPQGTSLHVGLTRATGFYDPGSGGGWAPDTCEVALADGRWAPPDVANNGVNGQQGRLFEHGGLRFFELDTGADPEPLKTWFEGALVGALDDSDPYSSAPTVVAGAAYALHAANADFNDGFLRERAVLALFLFSGWPDLSPTTIPTEDFIDIVSDAKSSCGDICVITTGAIPGTCYDQPANVNTRLYDFMNGFGAPPVSWTDLPYDAAPDFTGVLDGALADAIGTTCEQIQNGA